MIAAPEQAIFYDILILESTNNSLECLIYTKSHTERYSLYVNRFNVKPHERVSILFYLQQHKHVGALTFMTSAMTS